MNKKHARLMNETGVYLNQLLIEHKQISKQYYSYSVYAATIILDAVVIDDPTAGFEE